MKAALGVLVALGLGALAANFLLQDNGYVLIHFRGRAFEMSVPVLVFLLVLAYAAVRLLIHLFRAPRKLGELAARRRFRKSGERIVQGYIEMGDGNFARGEKLLTRGVRESETPLLNYLAAARAAQAQGDIERRNNWLDMALEQEPRAAAVILLTQAELQYQNGEFGACRASLERVLETKPRNGEALRMLAELSLDEGDWDLLRGLLPRLRKLRSVPAALLDDWTVRTWSQLIAGAADQPALIQELIRELPRGLRDQPRIVGARGRALAAAGRTREAETAVRKGLEKHWDDELVSLYGLMEGDPVQRLKRVEKWLSSRPEDPVLLLAAARLCVQGELWGKARSYFETSNAIRPSPATWHELGQLMLRLGETESASRAFQEGLTLNYADPSVPRLTGGSMADNG